MGGKPQRYMTMVGLAMLWCAVFSQLLRPESLSAEEQSIFNPLYFVVLLLLSLVMILAPQRIRVQMTSRRSVLVVLTILAALGTLVAEQTLTSGAAAIALASVGTALVAAWTLVCFVYWFERMSWSEQVLGDVLLSVSLACGIVLVTSLLDLSTIARTGIYVLGSLAMQLLVERYAGADDDAIILEGDGGPAARKAPDPYDNLVLSVAAVVFILLITGCALYYNLTTANSSEPTARYVIYAIDMAAFLAFSLIARVVDSRGGDISPIQLFCGFVTVLVVFMVVACFMAPARNGIGSMMLVAGKHLMEVLLFLMVLRRCASGDRDLRKHLAIAFACGLVVPNLIGAVLRLAFSGFFVEQDLLVSLGLAVAVALAVCLLTIGLLSWYLHGLIRMSSQPVASQQQDDGFPVAAVSAWGLSNREEEIARLAYENLSTTRIAERLVIEKSTVYAHMKSIYRKAGVHSKDELLNALDALRDPR